MSDKLFVFDVNKIPDNFLKLSIISTTVNNTHAFDNCPLFFQIENNNFFNSRNQNKLCIYQFLNDKIVSDYINKIMAISNYSQDICHKLLYQTNFNLEDTVDFLLNNEEELILKSCSEIIIRNNSNQIKIATFYNHYNYTRSIIYLLRSTQEKENFRFYVEHKNILDCPKFIMNIHVYIDRLYLNKLYDSIQIPNFLINLIKYESQKKSMILDISETSILKANIKLRKKYKREFYNYQKCNIDWMINLENSIEQGFKLSTFFVTSSKFIVYKICSIDDYLITNPKGEFINPEKMDQIHIFPKGGVLCDNIGLGKTSTILGLINETLDEQTKEEPTLVICPARLCKQWGQEIEIISNLKYKIITTITQFKNFKRKKYNFNDFNIIIISYSFLTNINYQNFQEQEPQDPYLLKNIKWKRIVMDESHEYISKKKMRRMPILLTKKAIEELDFKYIWLCSGTPFSNNDDFFEIIKFLCQNEELKNENDFNSIKHISNKFLEYMFRKNNTCSLKNTIYIPEPNISTHFLEQSEIEQAIYNSSLGNIDKMIQLCSHILVSEEHINILGNIPLPLDIVYQRMISYYKEKIRKLKSSISSVNDNIQKLEHSLEKNISEEKKIKKEIVDKKKKKIEFYKEKLLILEEKQTEYNSKLNIFEKIDTKTLSNSECPICFCSLENNVKVIFKCSHIFCSTCTTKLFINKKEINCPCCRFNVSKDSMEVVKAGSFKNVERINKWGTKMSYLINYLEDILSNTKNRVILFSQWDNLLKLVGNVLTENKINYLFLNGSIHVINSKIRKFKLDTSVRVVLLSSEKAVSGLNLTEANHIILLDTLNNDRETSKVIEEQAIGRAVRIGQTQTVNVKRLIMKNTIEYDFYLQNIEN